MKKLLLSVLSTFLLLSVFGVANATVLDFDNITSLTQPDTPVDLFSYGGLEWTNSQVVEEGWTYLGTPYYVNSAVSGDYAFVSNSGLVPVTVSILSGKFDFMGAYFTPADINNAGDIIVEAFLGTNSQGSQTIDLDGTEQWVDFSFTGIDKLVFTPDPMNNTNPSFFAMDDFTYNPVPEPATMFLFGLGLLGLAGANRRKQ